jgi:hypothetical protein
MSRFVVVTLALVAVMVLAQNASAQTPSGVNPPGLAGGTPPGLTFRAPPPPPPKRGAPAPLLAAGLPAFAAVGALAMIARRRGKRQA